MVRRIIAILLLLGTGGAAKGQTCTVTLNNVSDNPLLGGTSFNQTAGTISGSGYGFGHPLGTGVNGYNGATVLVTGYSDTVSAQVTAFSGAAGSQAGVIASFTVPVWAGQNPYEYLLFSVQNVSGTQMLEATAYIPNWNKQGVTWGVSPLYSAAYTRAIYLQIDRTSQTAATFSTSSDGVNWTQVATRSLPANAHSGGYYGVFANAGDNSAGDYGVGTLTNVSVNGSTVTLNDQDFGNVGNNPGSWQTQMQAGTFTDGHYFVSGNVALQNCTTGNDLSYNNFTSLVDNTTNTTLWAVQVFGSESCTSSCPNFSLEVPYVLNNPYSATLIHGHNYTFASDDSAEYAGFYLSNHVVKTITLNP